ncbi:MAG: hypothetical protein ABL903_19575, partial [Methylococcales bacterium]
VMKLDEINKVSGAQGSSHPKAKGGCNDGKDAKHFAEGVAYAAGGLAGAGALFPVAAPVLEPLAGLFGITAGVVWGTGEILDHTCHR